MRFLPVHWSEGMFLQPQQFQAADRYWASEVFRSHAWSQPYWYGLRSIKMDEAALSSGSFVVVACEARFKDGFTFELLEDGKNLSIEVEKALVAHPTPTVYLAIPKLNLGPNQTNVEQPANASESRFVESVRETWDETDGQSQAEIALKTPHVRLLAGQAHDLQSGYELLPIARLQRSSANSAIPTIDKSYIPPALTLSAWTSLQVDYIRWCHNTVTGRASDLARGLSDVDLTTTKQEDAIRIRLLAELNEFSVTSRCMLDAEGIHPFNAYLEMCRLVGRLAIFSESRIVKDIPAYDHDDLHSIFDWVKRQIDIFSQPPNLPYELAYFYGAGYGLQAQIRPNWLHPRWDWYFAIKAEDLTLEQCHREWGQVEYKLGGINRLENAFTNREPDVHKEFSGKNLPPQLISVNGWLFYKISRDRGAEHTRHWNHMNEIEQSQVVGMRISKHKIADHAALQGNDHMLLKAESGNQNYDLQFAIFAVDTARK